MKRAYNFIDLMNQKFNRLTVIGLEGTNKRGKIIWKCRCDCGNIIIVEGSSLKSGNTKSCGCLKREIKNEHKIKHGFLKEKKRNSEYVILSSMKQRCYNIKNNAYPRYGGRNIKVCDRWLEERGFENFLADMGPRPSTAYSIDRIDNNRDYCPENCRWATAREQSNNTRFNHTITFNGETKTRAQWEALLGLSHGGFSYRLLNWDNLDKIMTTPRQKNRPLKYKKNKPL